jgi:hypothetical protein
VLDNHLVELGTQERVIVLQVAGKRSGAFSTVPREFDIKPEFPHGENILFLHHSALRVPTWYTYLVSSRLFSGAVAGEQRKAFTTASFIE